MIANLCRMRVRRVQSLTVVLSGGLAALLVGCTSGGGGSDSFTPGPPLSSSSTPTQTLTPSRSGPLTTGLAVEPGEKPPALSRLAKAHDLNGAVAFAGYYIKALDWSYATTDPYLLHQISASTCDACKTVIDGLLKLQKEGSHAKGGRIHLESGEICECTDTQVKAQHIVKVVDTQDAGAIVRPNGTTSDNFARHRITTYVYLSWLGKGWKVVGEFK